MQSCREVPTLQSAKVVAVQSDLALTASLPGRNHSFAARSCQRDISILDNQEALFDRYLNHVLKVVQPLLKQFYSVPNEPSGRENIEAQAVGRTIPELLDSFAIGLGERSLYDDDSPCAPERPGKSRRPNHYRVHSRPSDIQKLDYGLREDFGKGVMPESRHQLHSL